MKILKLYPLVQSLFYLTKNSTLKNILAVFVPKPVQLIAYSTTVTVQEYVVMHIGNNTSKMKQIAPQSFGNEISYISATNKQHK